MGPTKLPSPWRPRTGVSRPLCAAQSEGRQPSGRSRFKSGTWKGRARRGSHHATEPHSQAGRADGGGAGLAGREGTAECWARASREIRAGSPGRCSSVLHSAAGVQGMDGRGAMQPSGKARGYMASIGDLGRVALYPQSHSCFVLICFIWGFLSVFGPGIQNRKSDPLRLRRKIRCLRQPPVSSGARTTCSWWVFRLGQLPPGSVAGPRTRSSLQWDLGKQGRGTAAGLEEAAVHTERGHPQAFGGARAVHGSLVMKGHMGAQKAGDQGRRRRQPQSPLGPWPPHRLGRHWTFHRFLCSSLLMLCLH